MIRFLKLLQQDDFERSFDQKDFDLMGRCLCDKVFCDYSSLRGDTPAELTAEEYVEKRRVAAADLKMQHSFSNLVLFGAKDSLTGTCDFKILRFSLDDFFHSFGTYTVAFNYVDCRWKIRSIVQKVLKNIGNPELHKGIKSESSSYHLRLNKNKTYGKGF